MSSASNLGTRPDPPTSVDAESLRPTLSLCRASLTPASRPLTCPKKVLGPSLSQGSPGTRRGHFRPLFLPRRTGLSRGQGRSDGRDSGRDGTSIDHRVRVSSDCERLPCGRGGGTPAGRRRRRHRPCRLHRCPSSVVPVSTPLTSPTDPLFAEIGPPPGRGLGPGGGLRVRGAQGPVAEREEVRKETHRVGVGTVHDPGVSAPVTRGTVSRDGSVHSGPRSDGNPLHSTPETLSVSDSPYHHRGAWGSGRSPPIP